MTTPAPGTRFLHASWLEDDYKTPLACVVTAVRKGAIYYKHEGGTRSFEKCTAERWPKVCKEVLP